jgi:hypothetical protein
MKYSYLSLKKKNDFIYAKKKKEKKRRRARDGVEIHPPLPSLLGPLLFPGWGKGVEIHHLRIPWKNILPCDKN